MGSLYKSGDAYAKTFTVSGSTGAAVNADATPTVAIFVNGASNAAAVTVTNPATGVYKAAATLPGAAGDAIDVIASATVGGIATKGVIDGFRLVAFNATDAVRLGLTALPATGTVAASVWDEIDTTSTHNITNSTGRLLRSITGGASNSLRTGTAQGGTSTTITLDAGASAVTDFYVPSLVSITGGTGAQQSATIGAYNGTTKVATLSGTDTWATSPDATSTFQIDPFGQVIVAKSNDKTGYALAAAQSFNNTGQTTKFAATLASTDVTGNLAADIQTIKTQAVTAAAPVTFPASIGTSTYAGGAVSSVTGSVTVNTINGLAPPANWSSMIIDGSGRIDLGKIAGDATAAAHLAAEMAGVFLGVVSSDAAPTTTSFTANTTGSPGLSATAGFYSTPPSMVVFYTGNDLPKAAKVTGYAVAGAVGTFTLASPLPVAPATGDRFMLLGLIQ